MARYVEDSACWSGCMGCVGLGEFAASRRRFFHPIRARAVGCTSRRGWSAVGRCLRCGRPRWMPRRLLSPSRAGALPSLNGTKTRLHLSFGALAVAGYRLQNGRPRLPAASSPPPQVSTTFPRTLRLARLSRPMSVLARALAYLAAESNCYRRRPRSGSRACECGEAGGKVVKSRPMARRPRESQIAISST
jgi:hypothetical protein